MSELKLEKKKNRYRKLQLKFFFKKNNLLTFFFFAAVIITLAQSISKPEVVKAVSSLQRQAQHRIDGKVNFQDLFPSTPKSNLKWVMHQ